MRERVNFRFVNTTANWRDSVATVHRLNCTNVCRDGFLGESVVGLNNEGRVTVTYLSEDVPNPSEYSDPKRQLLVVNQPLADLSALLVAGLMLHHAAVAIWSGTHILPSASRAGVLPAICTIAAHRASGETIAHVAEVRAYSPSVITIEDTPVGEYTGGDVISIRERQVREMTQWVSSLVPAMDVSD